MKVLLNSVAEETKAYAKEKHRLNGHQGPLRKNDKNLKNINGSYLFEKGSAISSTWTPTRKKAYFRLSLLLVRKF